jgi:hypothetical protein
MCDPPKYVTCLTGISLACYVCSFFLPAVGDGYGFNAFLAAAMFPFFWPMWAANPVVCFSLVKVFNQEWRAARKWGFFALGLALSESWMFWGSVKVGYFMWIGSMALIATAGCHGWAHEQRVASFWRAFDSAQRPPQSPGRSVASLSLSVTGTNATHLSSACT